MSRTVLGAFVATACALAELACGPEIAACTSSCEEATLETAASAGTSPSSTAPDSPLSGTDPTSTTAAATAGDPSSNTSSDESMGDSGAGTTHGDPSLCLSGGNILVLDGEPGSAVFQGLRIEDDAEWSLMVRGDPIDDIRMNITADVGQHWWEVWFATDDVPAPLAEGKYSYVMRTPFEDPGHPGLSVSADGAGCNTVSGYFEIHELEIVDNTVSRITATWKQHCSLADAALRGCVHWAQ